MLTESGVPPGHSFVYNFTVGSQVGTYWIHSHVSGQYPNGLRTPFIVLDPNPPYHWDDYYIVSLSDWVDFNVARVIVVQPNDAIPYSRIHES